MNGNELNRVSQKLDINASIVGKGNYRHFMHKEIHEQPRVVTETLVAYLNKARDAIKLPEMPFDITKVPQITIIACGTIILRSISLLNIG